MNALKVLIIGLDSVPPALAFHTYAKEMPTLQALRQRGVSGPLRSTDPPITVPAWVSMTSGYPPWKLGLYGFRKPISQTYDQRTVTSDDVTVPRIWNYLERQKRHSVVVSVPLTYPVASSPFTAMTGGFLTPSSDSRWASGPRLQHALHRRFGPYLVDVDNFRQPEPDRIFTACQRITQQHFAIFRHLVENRNPEFAMMVDIGPDRFHHALLRQVDPRHPHYSPSDKGTVYYRLLDKELRETLSLADPHTLVLVVSDHGVKPLRGAFCINDFLIQQGWLTVKKPLEEPPCPLSRVTVDWSKTTAFASGGYTAKVAFNTSRYPHGTISSTRVPQLRRRLLDDLSRLTTPWGAPLSAIPIDYDVPENACAGHPPDLALYLNRLDLRAAATVGHEHLFIPVNDTGVDDANHDVEGIFVAAGPGIRQGDTAAHLMDVFATALTGLGIARPLDTFGIPLQTWE